MMGRVFRWMICFAGLSGATAVLIAAATAHEPPAFLSDADLARVQTAVRYQIWHAWRFWPRLRYCRGGRTVCLLWPQSHLELAACCFAAASICWLSRGQPQSPG